MKSILSLPLLRLLSAFQSMHRPSFGLHPAQGALLALVLLLGLGFSRAQAQETLPTPTPTPQAAPPTEPTPTATALPSTTPGVAATPSPASLPSVVLQAPTRIEPNISRPVTGLGDPNRIIPLPPVFINPTPAPTATTAPVTPTPTPDGTGGTGDITGQEPPPDRFYLEAPGAIQDMERGLTLAQGGVTLHYGNFTVRGDRGIVDNNTNNATLAGNLTVTAQVNGLTQTFTGQTLVFNLDTGKWLLSQLQTTFPPDLFPPGTVLAPLYQRDGSVTGQGEGVRGENFRFSSCDRDHYYLRSNRIDFYRQPGGQPQRIVLRKNALFLLGRKILPLPVYTISLTGQRSRRQPLQTAFGQNDYDGFFAKSIYDLRATPKLTDSILIDALSKRGLGLGIQRDLIGGGLLYLYAVSGKSGGREVNARVNKQYQISKLVSSSISFQSSQNNTLTREGISARSGTFSLSRAGQRAQTNATYNFDSSSYSGSSSRIDTLNVRHDQQFGSGLSLSVFGDLNQSQFGNPADSPANQTGNLNVQVGKTSRTFDLFLRSELHNDFARGNSAFQLERLPELLVQSDSQRLQLGFLNKIAPGNLTFGLGTFNEPTNSYNTSIGGQKSRADFFYSANPPEIRLLGKRPNPQDSVPEILTDPSAVPTTPRNPNGSVLNLSGTFEQAFYSDDTARYNYAYNVSNTNTLGPIQVAVNYSKQRTFGFTPFQFDFLTPGEYVDYTASVGRGENFRLNFSGGRDIQNNYTRDILANLQWIPSRGTYISLGTSYGLQDAQRGLFGDIYGNIRFDRRQTRILGGRFALGFRYSPSGTSTARGLTRVNASFDTNVTSRVRFQAFAGYDGVNKRFDFQQYRAIVDLHCFNLFTTYDGTRKELRFDIALKAFPFTDTRFGRNNFSEGFDPSVGEVR